MLNEKREIFGFVLIGSELKKSRDFQVNICTADGKILFSKNNIFCMSVKGAENLIYIASRDDYSEMILNLDTKNICNLGQCRVAKEVEILNKKGDLIKITDYEREVYNNVRVYDLKTGKKLCDLCRYTEWLNKDETLLKCTYNYPTAMYNVRNYVFNIDNEKIITPCKCKDVRIFDKEQTLLEVIEPRENLHGLYEIKSGKIFLPCIYKEISETKHNLIKAKRSFSKNEYYNKDGQRFKNKSSDNDNIIEL